MKITIEKIKDLYCVTIHDEHGAHVWGAWVSGLKDAIAAVLMRCL